MSDMTREPLDPSGEMTWTLEALRREREKEEEPPMGPQRVRSRSGFRC